MKKYGFVYIWYDRKHKRYYIGCHWGGEDGGYICSSSNMKSAYNRRPQDFRRKILSRVFTTKKDLLQEEYRWLSKIKPEELGCRYYNLHNYHFNHWSTCELSLLSLREKILATATKNAQDPVYREKYLEGIKRRNNRSSDPVVREKRKQSMIRAMEVKYPLEQRRKRSVKGSEQHITKLSEASKKRWLKPGAKDIQADITRKLHTEKRHRLGHINTEEHIEKIRLANTGKKRTAEQKQRMSEVRKGKVMTPAMKEQQSLRIKEVWAKRKAGILPMPNYTKEKQEGAL